MVLSHRARPGLAASLVFAAGAAGQTLVSPNVESDGGFGVSVASVPDVNRDGRGEIVVGAPYENYGGHADAGRVYLFSGLGVRRLTLASPSAMISGGFGAAVTGIPDVNGDGFGDIGVGAPGEAGGAAYIFSGATGIRRLTLHGPGGFSAGNFGAAVAGLRDVTGDTRGDVAVGAPLAAEVFDNGLFQFSGPPTGRVYVFNGSNGTLVRSLGSPSDSPVDSDFGAAVASVPDADGDGRPEIAVSAPKELVGAQGFAGRVYVYSAATGFLLHTLSSPHPQHAGFFGASVSGVPDVNGDGRGDILVGAANEIVGNNPDAAGRAYLFSGKTGVLLRQFAAGSPEANDHFGSSVVGVADLNGDGRGDVVIGARGKTVPGSPAGSGRVYIYSGATGAFIRSFASPNQEVGGAFGASVTGLGDINGDGRGDLGIGAQFENVAPKTDAGRAYIIRY